MTSTIPPLVLHADHGAWRLANDCVSVCAETSENPGVRVPADYDQVCVSRFRRGADRLGGVSMVEDNFGRCSKLALEIFNLFLRPPGKHDSQVWIEVLGL